MLNQPLHVLHVIEAFGGGALTALLCLCQSARQEIRHSIAHGLRPETPPDFARMFSPDTRFHGIRMRRVIHFMKDSAALWELIALIRACKPDIVHCHSSKAGVLGRLAARICSVPSVYTPHGYSFLRTDIAKTEKQFYRAVEWIFSRIGDAIAACGDEEYALARALGVPERDVRLIRNAVDCDALNAVAPYDWNLQLPVAGICGRFTMQRRPDLFLALAERLQSDTAWVWIGGADEQRALPVFIKMTPWLLREEALARVAGLDIYVQTSSWEGLSYGILEAMALGKPVVACDIPSNRAIVEHGVTGFLGATADDLARFISLLACDPLLRETMGEAARKHIAKRHDIKTAYLSYTELYHDLAAHKNGKRRMGGMRFFTMPGSDTDGMKRG
ncbi:MAG: glycosyltransferase [Desulfovibrionaceae bacterium]|nr:glycosyltransferase [Desulfovibrionaceae bacterium]